MESLSRKKFRNQQSLYICSWQLKTLKKKSDDGIPSVSGSDSNKSYLWEELPKLQLRIHIPILNSHLVHVLSIGKKTKNKNQDVFIELKANSFYKLSPMDNSISSYNNICC